MDHLSKLLKNCELGRITRCELLQTLGLSATAAVASAALPRAARAVSVGRRTVLWRKQRIPCGDSQSLVIPLTGLQEDPRLLRGSAGVPSGVGRWYEMPGRHRRCVRAEQHVSNNGNGGKCGEIGSLWPRPSWLFCSERRIGGRIGASRFRGCQTRRPSRLVC